MTSTDTSLSQARYDRAVWCQRAIEAEQRVRDLRSAMLIVMKISQDETIIQFATSTIERLDEELSQHRGNDD